MNAQSLAWAAIYSNTGPDGGKAIAIDGSGNVYVGGNACTTSGEPNNHNMFLVKYNSSGTQLWTASYDGPGYQDASIKFDNDGIADIVLDSSGSNIYVTGTSWNGATQQYDITTIKYNSSGTQIWLRNYGAATTWDQGYSIGIGSGANANVFVTGESNLDLYLLKYNSSGTLQWATSYNGPGNSDDLPYDLKVVPSNNRAYVTGLTYNSGGSTDCLTLKYNTITGAIVWSAIYNSAANGPDEAYSVDVDVNSNVYVCGITTVSSIDGLLLKYNSAGGFVWASTYDNGGGADGFHSLDVDNNSSASIYVTGQKMIGNNIHDHDYITAKYNAAGTQQWITSYDGSASGAVSSIDEPTKILISPFTGKIWVTGSSEETTTGNDITTIRYNPSTGAQEWIDSYDNINKFDETGDFYPMAIAYDACHDNDIIYITGATEINTSPDWDVVTLKYNVTGDCTLRTLNDDNAFEEKQKDQIYPDNSIVTYYNLLGEKILEKQLSDKKLAAKDYSLLPGIYIKIVQNSGNILLRQKVFITRQ